MVIIILFSTTIIIVIANEIGVSANNSTIIYKEVKQNVTVYEETRKNIPCKNELNLNGSLCIPSYEIIITPVQVEQTIKKERIGVKVLEKEYLGNYNYNNGIMNHWNVNIGDRNFKEYPNCLKYELEKGVCKHLNIIV